MHSSAAVPAEAGHSLIHEFGLALEEVAASNLVKVNLRGAVVGTVARTVNPTGFTIHAAVHATADVERVIHLHSPLERAAPARGQGHLDIPAIADTVIGNLIADAGGEAAVAAERQQAVGDRDSACGRHRLHSGSA